MIDNEKYLKQIRSIESLQSAVTAREPSAEESTVLTQDKGLVPYPLDIKTNSHSHQSI